MKNGILKSAKETCRNQSLEINQVLKRPGQENLFSREHWIEFKATEKE